MNRKMKVEVLDKSAKKVGTVELQERLFGRVWNPDLVHQALRIQSVNKRANIAHTKDRGDVRGGGKKPWRQKGLGRARHGSIRSPIWKGGGVTFGPRKEKIFALRLNKKMRQGAIFSAFSRRVKDGEVKVIDSLAVNGPKTKEVTGILKSFSGEGSSFLIIPAVDNKDIYKASRNISNVKSIDPRSLNVYDILKYKSILLDKGAIGEIEKHYHAVK